MSAVDLLQPILNGGLQRNNFFNGRLLSAEDLRAEQDATNAQASLLARAGGEGVGWGYGVTMVSTSPPRVRVGRGLALNRLGNLLHLPDDADVALVPTTQAIEDSSGLFAECEPPRPTTALTGAGAYVLVVAPSSGYRGTALVSDPNTTAAGRGACGARFTVAGVRFRLVPMWISELDGISDALRAQIVSLLPPADVPARERLRNKLAHLCLGTQELGFADPPRRTAIKPVPPGWGALDAMRTRGDLTDCDVPLAVVVLTEQALSYVDVWAARRRLIDASAIDVWRAVASPRRLAEGEAAFLQFQSQLEIVRGLGAPGAVVASTYFDVLPAGGWLPTGTGNFDWARFLGPHAPPTVTPVDSALLRGILGRSWLDEPFALSTNPPVPVRVFAVPEQAAGDSFIVFARSSLGNIRVVLSPAPGSTASVEVTATAATGAQTRATTRNGATVPIPELTPGAHSVTITAPDYVAVPAQNATVVGGRTVDLTVGLTPLPNGSILVTPVDKASPAVAMGERVIQVLATGGGVSRAGTLQPADGKWLIEDLPPATYTISGTARGYKPASKPDVGPTVRGVKFPTTLIFEQEEREQRPQPKRCIDIRELKRPALQNVRICLVLSASEFEEEYFYGMSTKMLAPRARTSAKMRIEQRAETSKTTRRNRYTSGTGEIIYTVEPWRDQRMVPLEPLPGDVRVWLADWAEWFAIELDDPSIAKHDPFLLVDRTFAASRQAKDIQATPPGYAVFSHFGVPISIKLLELVTKAAMKLQKEHLPGITEEVMERLYEAEIVTIDDLAWSWEELILDATGQPPEDVRYLIADSATAIKTINDGRLYYNGVDKGTDKILKDLGINDDVGLANADKDKLAEKLGSRGFAIRLIDQARKIVPRDSWSLESLELSTLEIDGLRARGVDSKGDLVSKSGTAGGRAEIVDALGLNEEAAPVREATVAALTNEAVLVMTLNSVALAPQTSVAAWSGVDSLTASKLAKADYVTLEDLAAADAAAVADAASIGLPEATKLVSDAKAASRAGLSVGTLASVGRGEEKNLKDLLGADNATVGGLSTKSADEIAGAFGGNVGRANAVLAGIRAGLRGRGGIL